MSLYHEAATILQKAGGRSNATDETPKGSTGGTSLKTLVFGQRSAPTATSSPAWKSDARTLLAMTADTAKWSDVLAEVLDASGLLAVEKNLTPTLALLLAHDLLLSKKGVALPASHGLYLAIHRHKARLTAELTKIRIRRGFPTLDALRASITETHNISGSDAHLHPRWIRVNTLRSSLDQELTGTFSGYTRVAKLDDVLCAKSGDKLVHVDTHVPNLLAITPGEDVTRWRAYREGRLVLQEKASCFPAILLDPAQRDGDVLDTCAAPGNKTTHLAALVRTTEVKVIACERDPERSKTLAKMVKLAGADQVIIKPRQDFLRLDPEEPEFSNVTSLLLDPSCSGSGIWGRDEAHLTIHLPKAPAIREAAPSNSKSKKRKRELEKGKPIISLTQPDQAPVHESEEESPTPALAADQLAARLQALSEFQLRLLLRAMAFPAAQRITYSTCSIHATENEHVVVNALLSQVARERRWRVLKRNEQVTGMQEWPLRGQRNVVHDGLADSASETRISPAPELDMDEVAEACIRCDKGGKHGTMGFFVAGFIRDPVHGGMPSARGNSAKRYADVDNVASNAEAVRLADEEKEEGEGEEWNGFDE